MVPFKNFSHVSLHVSDVDKAKAFYTGVLGLEQIPRPAFDFPGAWYGLRDGLALHLIQSDTWKSPRQFQERFEFRAPHFALWVEDADEVHQRLSETGYTFRDVVQGPTGMRQMFLCDPDGNMIEFLGPSRHAAAAQFEAPAAARAGTTS